jgi:methionyl-tRNA formyltransferase
MRNIAIIGTGEILDTFTEALVRSGNFNIQYLVAADKATASSEIFRQTAKNYQTVTIEKLDEIQDIRAVNALLVLTYYHKIPSAITQNILCINIHSGILPFWRGMSANSWAILNGVEKVGFTIHKMNELYDSGDIYAVYEARVRDFSSYMELRNHLILRMKAELPQLLKEIIDGRCVPVSQSGHEHCYTAKMLPDDGIITNWNREVDYYLRFQYIFGYPNGTGLYIQVNNECILVGRFSRMKNLTSMRYNCPGSIVYSDDTGKVGIQVSDGILIVESLFKNGRLIPASETLKLHMRL